MPEENQDQPNSGKGKSEDPNTRAEWLSTVVVLIVVIPTMALFVLAAHDGGWQFSVDMNAYFLGAVVLAFLSTIVYTLGGNALKVASEAWG